MKIAVIGSRSFNDYKTLVETLDETESDLIISGGAIGADSLAEKYAKEMGINTLIFLPEWDKYGKRAGFIRNKEIISNCDRVIAFWDGISKGTLNSINLAKRQGKDVTIILF